MGTHAISKVVAVRDAVDRLEWEARISTDFYGTNHAQIFLFRWDGRVRFYREPTQSKASLSLSAKWSNASAARLFSPGQQELHFTTELTPSALDRIEAFRGGGRIFARVEGMLFLVHKSGHTGASASEWAVELAQMLGDSRRSLGSTIVSEPLELSRDVWCGEILSVLRPPGRLITEIALPTVSAEGETALRAINHLKEAQLAFDHGRWAETARVCYCALEELKKASNEVSQRYGEYAKARLLDQIKAIGATCNVERHSEEVHHDGLEFDRALAAHVLASSWSVAGVFFP